MNVTAEFEKWAKSFSGCDGGNLHGSVWFCGLEWGTGKEHHLTETKHPVYKPPQIYKSPEDVVKNVTTGKPYPFGVKLIKLITAIRGGSVSDYESVAYGSHFPFHRKSEFFKLNLFPLAFRSVSARLWTAKYKAATGLQNSKAYLEWCRANRFPKIRAWMKLGQPKLIVGVGITHKEDFLRAFGSSSAIHEESVGGERLVWTTANAGKSRLAIIPFLGHQQGCLNSNQLLQTFGERLGAILVDKECP